MKFAVRASGPLGYRHEQFGMTPETACWRKEARSPRRVVAARLDERLARFGRLVVHAEPARSSITSRTFYETFQKAREDSTLSGERRFRGESETKEIEKSDEYIGNEDKFKTNRPEQDY